MANKNIPTGIKVISILYYIAAAIVVILGILTLVGAGDVIGIVMLFGGGVAMGIILIAIAILCFFIGRGLWKGQNWARIVALIISSLGALGAIMSLVGGNFSGIAGLIIHGIIVWYVGFNKDVKAAFS